MATKTRPTKKAVRKLSKKLLGYVVYGTAGGKQGNANPEGGFRWLEAEPKLYKTPAAVKRAITKANSVLDGIYADPDVHPAAAYLTGTKATGYVRTYEVV